MMTPLFSECGTKSVKSDAERIGGQCGGWI